MILDLHTHILPLLDDGAKTPEMAQEMLQTLMEQGCTHVVLTPHFYPDDEPAVRFCKARDKSVRQLQTVQWPPLLPLYLGSEVCLHALLFSNTDLTHLCVAGSPFMLLEMPFSPHWEEKVLGYVYRLIRDFGITPILAHVERYPALRHDRSLLGTLCESGCLIQINAESLCGSMFQNRWALRLLREGLVHFIGSDCHNMSTRAPNLRTALQLIQAKGGPNAAKQLQVCAERLLCAAKPLQ